MSLFPSTRQAASSARTAAARLEAIASAADSAARVVAPPPAGTPELPGALVSKPRGTARRAARWFIGAPSATPTSMLSGHRFLTPLIGAEVALRASHVNVVDDPLTAAPAPEPLPRVKTIDLKDDTTLTLRGPGVDPYDGPVPLSPRVGSVGITKDIQVTDDDVLRLAAEIELNEKSVGHLSQLATRTIPDGSNAIAHGAQAVTETVVADVAASAIAAAVPLASTVFAVRSTAQAVHAFRDPNASKKRKVISVAHAVSDAVGIVVPFAAPVGRAATSAAALTTSIMKERREQKRALADMRSTLPGARDAARGVDPTASRGIADGGSLVAAGQAVDGATASSM